MSCITDFSLLCTETNPSNCVIWEGADIPCLGITKGTSITPVIANIAEKVCELIGDVNVSSVTITGDLIALLGTKDKSIANLFQVLFDYDVTLKGLIDALKIAIDNNHNIVVDYKCMSNHTGPTTIETAIDTIISYCCYLNNVLSQTISGLTTTIYNNVNQAINGAFSSPVDKRVVPNGQSGTNFRVQFWGFVPPYVAMPYFGGLDFFDASGKGITGTFMERWYICNGNHGTPDLRGRTIVGAVAGIPGITLSPEVDPAYNGGMGNYGSWHTGGTIRVRLTMNQIPSHKHDVYDQGHRHEYEDSYATPTNGGPIGGGWASNHTKSYTYVQKTSENGIANIAESFRGGDDYHENRMPYTGAVWIMMID